MIMKKFEHINMVAMKVYKVKTNGMKATSETHI